MFESQELLNRLRVAGCDVQTRDAADLASRDPGSHPQNFGAGLMLLPATVRDIQEIVRHCAALSIPIVTQGGRTGLVGGTISAEGSVIVSTERMNRIEEIDRSAGVAVVEAGVTLLQLQQAVQPYGLEPGIDLGARGTATIGGMVATNAGGIQAFRHGVMRQRVVGLEAVMPDGTVFSDMTRVIKSSTGYDVKQLLIGSEGTLGIVSRVVVRLTPAPAQTATILLALRDVAAGFEIANLARAAGGVDLLACEMMWRDFLCLNVEAHGAQLADSFTEAPACLLLEVAGPTAEAAEASLLAFSETLLEKELVVDAILATSVAQRERLWHLREDMSVFEKRYAGYKSFDVSVPQQWAERWCEEISRQMEAIEPGMSPLVFGHVADGNLHVIPRRGNYTEEMRDRVERVIYAELAGMGGSISAEHGIGTIKRKAFESFAPKAKRELIAQIKRTIDPGCLFNPGKILSETMVK